MSTHNPPSPVPHAPAFAADGFDVTPRTRLVYGNGALRRLGGLAKELGARRALIVTDTGIVGAGHVARAEASLREAGIETASYTQVRENPTTRDVDQCRQMARDEGIDLFIGLGGGSSMDTAKGANFLLTNGGEMRDYWGVGKAVQPLLPLIAIPTTSGTGSECQSAALIADEVTHQKMACLDPKAAARVALLDPELTVSQPARVTAVTGIDAVAHAVETAVTRKKTPYSWVFSQEAFRLCARALPRVLAEPDNLEERGHMLLGAAYAGIAIESSMLGAAHSAANPLTARLGIVHGHAVGLMLPGVIQFNAEDSEAREAYAQLARAAGWAGSHLDIGSACAVLVEGIRMLLKTAEMSRTWSDGVVSADEVAELIPNLASEAAGQWTAQFNPRTIVEDDFARLYKETARA